MKRLFFLVFLFNLSFCIYSNTYFVSSSIGNDNNNGLSSQFPFQSIDKLNSLNFNPGDSILFKSGDSFNGMLWVKGSGTTLQPIVVNSYAGSAKPIINGDGYQSCILIYNNEHISINNLELTNENSYLDNFGNAKKLNGFGGLSNSWGSGRDVRFGVKIVGDTQSLTNFKMNDLYIHDIYPSPMDSAHIYKGYGIKLETTSNDSLVMYNTISNVDITNLNITRTGHYGIWVKSLGLSGIDSIKNTQITLKDCSFEYTGGSGFVPNKCDNILVENCIFNHTGSDIDSRMWKRGSGMWTFKCKNVVSQHNKFMNAHGPQDSYGCHIDYGNENVVYQYNFSYNNEGGFVEILGDNINCGYRYNISVNDGYRLDPNNAQWDKKGKIFWVSNFCGNSGIRCPSTGTFIYNNTVFVNDSLNPEIYFWPNIGDVHFYNNLVYVGSTGNEIPTLIQNTSNSLNISHNLFYDSSRINLDNDLLSNIIYENPLFLNPSLLGNNNPLVYKIRDTSQAANAGKLINGSTDSTDYLNNNGGRDYFGNSVSANHPSTIGAYNASSLWVNVPDDNFEAYLEANGLGDGIIGNDTVSKLNISGKLTLDVSNQNISDLTGISYFTGLISLNCKNNSLTSLDISQNTALQNLNCRYNQISSLDVTQNTSLTILNCSDNNLSSIDISQNTALTKFSCEDNQLSAVDVTNNTVLNYFICGDNQITNLDLSSNNLLNYFGCHGNQLTSLDVSNNTSLEVLSFGQNSLTTIDISSNTLLTEFRCYENQLTALDLSLNTNLSIIDISYNPLTCFKLTNGNNININVFDAVQNPNLNCIEVDDPNWSNANWINIDAGTTFSINCNYSFGCF